MVLTATLTSEGTPLAGKLLTFAATVGGVTPLTGTTDSNGKVEVTYIAPQVSIITRVDILASFLGDLNHKASSATSSGTIEVELTLPKISVQGAAFSLPESIRDNISQYTMEIPEEIRKMLPLPVPSTGFILATIDSLSLILSDRCDKGIGKVDGWALPKDIELGGVSLNVILAENLSFYKEGEPATAIEILASSSDYELELVKVLTFRRQISILYDPDDGTVEIPITVGYLTDEEEDVTKIIRVVRGGGDLIKDPGTIVRDILRTRQSRLPVFDFEYDYWMGVRTETNGIVLLPGAKILDLLRRIVPMLDLIELDELPIIYDVKTDLVYTDVPSIEEAYKEEYVGKVVGLSANGFGGGISIQESIKATTGETIPVDVCLEGLEAWNTLSVPPKRGELITVFGASNVHKDEAFSRIDGEFKYIGRVISTKQIDESLPEMPALLLYQRQKVGEIDYEELAESVKEEIEDRLGELYFVLTNFMEEQPPGAIPIKTPMRVVNPVRPIIVEAPEAIPHIIEIAKKAALVIRIVRPETPVSLEIQNSTISKIEMSLVETREQVNITIEKLEERPPDLPEPPGLVWAYHEIGSNVPKEAIESAGISFCVMKEWLKTNEVIGENIKLLRYQAQGWESLPTEVVDESPTHFYYSAETTRFSTFAITAFPVAVPSPTPTPLTTPTPTPMPTPTPTPTPQPSLLPYIGAISIALIVAIVVILIRKRS